ncbi:MAG: OmpA family protein [Litoreibacter sp.]|nr:OmpA family protein [Litoreibacter sp.]
MLKSTSTLAILTAASFALSACSADFYREAGAQVDEGAFGNPTMTNTLIANGELAAVEGLKRRFEDEVPASVNFDFNSATLDAASQSVLMKQAAWIKQFPEVRFRVYGHTDLVGSDGYNKSLGLRRAQTVVSFLTQQGISRSRLEAVVSFGETQPLVVTEGRERRNRRTVTEVTGFVSGHPSLLDGKYARVIYREHVESAGRAVFDEVSAGVAQ